MEGIFEIIDRDYLSEKGEEKLVNRLEQALAVLPLEIGLDIPKEEIDPDNLIYKVKSSDIFGKNWLMYPIAYANVQGKRTVFTGEIYAVSYATQLEQKYARGKFKFTHAFSRVPPRGGMVLGFMYRNFNFSFYCKNLDLFKIEQSRVELLN